LDLLLWVIFTIADGTLEAAGTTNAIVSLGNVLYTSSNGPTILAAKYGNTTVEDLNSLDWVNRAGFYTYEYNGNTITYIKIGKALNITKAAATGGSFTVIVDGAEVAGAVSGDTVALSAAPGSGYSFSSWNVYETGDSAVKVTVTGNTFVMPAYPVTVEAAFSENPVSDDTPRRTITVTETSSGLFQHIGEEIKADADMQKAFTSSVEVRVTDTKEKASDFGLGAGKDIYPFDISLYIKGTNTKVEPKDGYAVTISLPIPESLLVRKERLSIVHKAVSGEVTTLSSRLVQNNGIWYLVFEARDFSPYAMAADIVSAYDESAGVPYYIDSDGNTVFIGFAANGKYLAPDGVSVLFKHNSKTFKDVSGHWAVRSIDFVTEREILTGIGTGTFSPNLGMTRGEFAAVIVRLYERSYGAIVISDVRAFTDCSDDRDGKYVEWAAEKGILSGYGDGRFGPNDPVTREQAAVILYRFLDFLGAMQNPADAVLNYPDADTISAWAEDAARYCQSTGIITGRDGRFVPQGAATRAEIAAMLQRFIENVVK